MNKALAASEISLFSWKHALGVVGKQGTDSGDNSLTMVPGSIYLDCQQRTVPKHMTGDPGTGYSPKKETQEGRC